MHFSTDDTIVAIASAPGGALRGIVRLSGPTIVDCLHRCFRLDAASPDADPPAGNVPARTLVDVRLPEVLSGHLCLTPQPGAVEPISAVGESPAAAWLPCELCFWPDRRSYTRQPTAELHTIGSPPLLEAALATLCAAGARLAEPGEFTLRAFLAGRLDLTQAEAVLGVIDAGDRSELDVALAQLAGGLAGPLQDLRNRLLDLLAHLEAGLDFVDEEIEFITAAELDALLCESIEAVERIVARMTARSESRGDLRVALVGLPNVGKSSLLNALTGEEAAIVADQPGTTRDYVVRRLLLAGVACQLIDTAGVEQVARSGSDAGDASDLSSAGASATAGSIAGQAQSVASAQHAEAHLLLFCLDGSRPPTEWERQQLAAPANGRRIVVLTKCDRTPCEAYEGAFAGRIGNASDDKAGQQNVVDRPSWIAENPVVRTSSATGEGLDALRQAIARQAAESAGHESAVVAGTAVRCEESLRTALASLFRARDTARRSGQEELVAADLRQSLDELGKVVGAVYTDDVLDRIFSRFCIGK